MMIHFTGEYEPTLDGWLIFHVLIDGHPSYCRVSEDALSELFGSQGGAENDIAAYVLHRDTIHGIARFLILKGNTNGLGGADVDPETAQRYGAEARRVSEGGDKEGDGDVSEPRYFLTTRCRRCQKTLQFIGLSEDDLRKRLAASRWRMVADAPMADPINDSVEFVCPDCPSPD